MRGWQGEPGTHCLRMHQKGAHLRGLVNFHSAPCTSAESAKQKVLWQPSTSSCQNLAEAASYSLSW